MITESRAIPPKAAASLLWVVLIGLLSLLSAVFAGIWLCVTAAVEHSLLRSSTVTGGIILLLAGAAYGFAEIVRRLRSRPPRVHLPLSALFLTVVFLSGGLLIFNGLVARRRSAATRIQEQLRIIDEAIAHANEQPMSGAK